MYTGVIAIIGSEYLKYPLTGEIIQTPIQSRGITNIIKLLQFFLLMVSPIKKTKINAYNPEPVNKEMTGVLSHEYASL